MSRYEVARSAVEAEQHELVYGEREWHVPARLPLAAIEAMEQNDVMQFLRLLLGDEYADFAEYVDARDLPAIADTLGDIYGMALGESAASGNTSEGTTGS